MTALSTGSSRSGLPHDVIRVLVVGPVFAGKSTLLSSIGRDDEGELPRRRVLRTVGCHTEASVHCSGSGEEYHVEWLEVGAASQFRDARSAFYRDFDGILAVFDVAAERSYQGMRDMVAEIVESVSLRLTPHAAAAAASPVATGGRRGTAEAAAEDEDDGVASTGPRRRWAAAGAAPGGSFPTTASTSAHGSAAERPLKTHKQLLTAALRRIPLLIVANKCDILEAGRVPPASAELAQESWQQALTSGSSQIKLDVSVKSTDSRSVTICGMTCNRPQRLRLPLDARVATASALADNLPLDAIESFLDDVVASKFADGDTGGGEKREGLVGVR